MEIQIKCHDTIGGMLKANYRQYDVILYTNSNKEAPRHIETHCRDMIHLSIDDCDKPMKNKVIITKEDLERVLEWSTDREKLICCCHAGVSRSSATAYLLACRAWGPKAALSILRPGKHYPNRLIVHYGSQILNNPEIWTTFVHWQKKETNIDPGNNWPL